MKINCLFKIRVSYSLRIHLEMRFTLIKTPSGSFGVQGDSPSIDTPSLPLLPEGGGEAAAQPDLHHEIRGCSKRMYQTSSFCVVHLCSVMVSTSRSLPGLVTLGNITQMLVPGFTQVRHRVLIAPVFNRTFFKDLSGCKELIPDNAGRTGVAHGRCFTELMLVVVALTQTPGPVNGGQV